MKLPATLLLVLLAAMTATSPSLSQTAAPSVPPGTLTPGTPPPGAQPPQAVPLALGSPCARRTDNRLGIVKKDACNRVYCGRTDIKDITELQPNFAADHGCSWTLVAGHCKCEKIMSRPRP